MPEAVNYNANEVINGLYGYLYDENGQHMQETQEFELSAEFEKTEVLVPGKFFKSHKVMGGTLSGSMRLNKKDSRLTKKIIDNPTGKYNYLGKLDDPDAKGQEAILILGLSFDADDILKWALGEAVEVELDFTADDMRYTEWIE